MVSNTALGFTTTLVFEMFAAVSDGKVEDDGEEDDCLDIEKERNTEAILSCQIEECC